MRFDGWYPLIRRHVAPATGARGETLYYVARWYPHTMHRSWAVMDITGKPHSLWLRLRDAEEMCERLSALEAPRSAYKPLDAAQDPQEVLGHDHTPEAL